MAVTPTAGRSVNVFTAEPLGMVFKLIGKNPLASGYGFDLVNLILEKKTEGS